MGGASGHPPTLYLPAQIETKFVSPLILYFYTRVAQKMVRDPKRISVIGPLLLHDYGVFLRGL